MWIYGWMDGRVCFLEPEYWTTDTFLSYLEIPEQVILENSLELLGEFRCVALRITLSVKTITHHIFHLVSCSSTWLLESRKTDEQVISWDPWCHSNSVLQQSYDQKFHFLWNKTIFGWLFELCPKLKCWSFFKTILVSKTHKEFMVEPCQLQSQDESSVSVGSGSKSSRCSFIFSLIHPNYNSKESTINQGNHVAWTSQEVNLEPSQFDQPGLRCCCDLPAPKTTVVKRLQATALKIRSKLPGSAKLQLIFWEW